MWPGEPFRSYPFRSYPFSDLHFLRPVADVATGVVLPSVRRAQMLAILAQACLQADGYLVSYFADLSPRRQRFSDLDFPTPVADVATGVVLPSGRRAQMLAILAQACLQAVGSLVSYFADLSPRRQRLSDLDFSTPVADVATGVVHSSVARGSGFRITRYGVTRFRISIFRDLSLTWPRGSRPVPDVATGVVRPSGRRAQMLVLYIIALCRRFSVCAARVQPFLA